MRKKIKTLISFSLVIIIIVFFHFLGWLAPLENLLRQVTSPLSSRIYQFGTNWETGEEQYDSPEELLAETKKLRDLCLQNQVETAQLISLKAENAELRTQLKFKEESQQNLLGANILGKNLDPLEKAIIVNQGTRAGVRIGDPVISGPGVLVGKIVRSEEETSIVRLINDQQSKVGATLINHDASLGLIEGGFGLSIQLNYIPQNETINVGDLVVTSGLEKNIPAGLLIGTIEAVEKEAYQPFQKAIITPALNLDKIKQVSILLNPPEDL